MTIVITGNILAGIAAGALTFLIAILPFALMGAAVESMMSLGGSSGGFLKKLATGAAIYMPIGAIVGLVVVLAGAPWWVAIPAAAVVFVAICVISQKLEDRQNAR
jgi:hypothetical protein